MNRTVIVARIKPGSQEAVADLFARSDTTGLPHRIGVTERTLYGFHDLYLHIIDFDRPPAEAMRTAQAQNGFREISEQLRPYIVAYDPAWSSPADAMARPFYHWSAVGAPVVP